jgi:hypothetical protein
VLASCGGGGVDDTGTPDAPATDASMVEVGAADASGSEGGAVDAVASDASLVDSGADGAGASDGAASDGSFGDVATSDGAADAPATDAPMLDALDAAEAMDGSDALGSDAPSADASASDATAPDASAPDASAPDASTPDASDAADAAETLDRCAGVTCTALDACHAVGVCDPATGLCSQPFVPDGTSCDDKNACTTGDVCTAGSCAGTPVVCTARDACHVAGTCDPATGACSAPFAPDGTTCTPTATCAIGNTCTAGVCGTVCASGACGATLGAFSGSATSGWSFNGSAFYDGSANVAVLTSGASSAEAGSLIYQRPIVADAFTVSFDFTFNTSGGRADGLMFVLETDGATSVGAPYGGFGALGLHGYGVELDIFDSGPCDPGNGNHASIDLLSACSTNGGIPTPIAASADLYDGSASDKGVGDIGDGAWRTATITLSAGALSVSVKNPAGRVIAVSNLQGVSLPGFTSGTPYYFGFTAGSGSNGLYARSSIRNVAISFPSTHCL